MILYVVPMDMRGFERHNVAVRLREGENPALFMQNVAVTQDGSRDDIKSNYSYKRQNASLSIFGDVEEGMDLQDGDTLLIQAKGNPLEQSVMFEMENKDGVYLTKGVEFSSISIASCMEERLCVCIADSEYKNVMSTAVQVFNKTIELYKEYPAFRNIMVKNEEGETCEQSILGLIATQNEKFIKWAETMLRSMAQSIRHCSLLQNRSLNSLRRTRASACYQKRSRLPRSWSFPRNMRTRQRKSCRIRWWNI